MDRVKRSSKKIVIGIAGGTVTLVGLLLVPYPGPGWLIVFAGLAILSREFTFAQKALAFAKGKYDAWTGWLKRQNIVVKSLALLLTGAVVAVSVWLFNGFGILNSLLSLNQDWLISPLFR
jgi:uncharacterized protein (TIGR02611 family)